MARVSGKGRLMWDEMKVGKLSNHSRCSYCFWIMHNFHICVLSYLLAFCYCSKLFFICDMCENVLINYWRNYSRTFADCMTILCANKWLSFILAKYFKRCTIVFESLRDFQEMTGLLVTTNAIHFSSISKVPTFVLYPSVAFREITELSMTTEWQVPSVGHLACHMLQHWAMIPFCVADRQSELCEWPHDKVYWVRILLLCPVEHGSSVVECRTCNRESPGSNPLCYRFKDWIFSLSSRHLSWLTCINEYLAIDSRGHVSDLVLALNCCPARMLPGEAELVSEWTGLPGRAKSVDRFNGLDTALYKNDRYLFFGPSTSLSILYCAIPVSPHVH